jgi:hypothetical protein
VIAYAAAILVGIVLVPEIAAFARLTFAPLGGD